MQVLIESLDVLLERANPAARRSYLPPAQRDQAPQVPDGTNLEVWSWEDESGKPHAICFWGNANKPLWHHRFSNDQQRQRKIDATVERSRSHVKGKESARKEKLAFKHTLKVGDILYSSWGYDQTNIDFYEIVRVSEKSVWTYQVRTKTVETDQGTRVVPNEGDYIFPRGEQAIDEEGTWYRLPAEKKPRRHKLNIHPEEQEARWKYSIKVHSWGTWAHPWGGTPLYDTIAAGDPGH